MATIEGFATMGEYLRAVENDPRSAALLQRLASHLTNNESYFFRELDQLSLLVKLVAGHPSVPAVRHRRRILSAGCSTGEEPYSIAVMLADSGLLEPSGAPEIVGLDIDRRALALAREGVYPPRSMRGGMPGRISGRHIIHDGDRLKIHDDVRASVTFVEGNIMQPCDLGRFDFILCRNVLIYFADSAIERVARVLFRLLLPGGCLFLGHSESLCRIATDFEMTQIDGLIVYRRPAAGEALP
jgi:chemotaxis protein methyltransferase CheR